MGSLSHVQITVPNLMNLHHPSPTLLPKVTNGICYCDRKDTVQGVDFCLGHVQHETGWRGSEDSNLPEEWENNLHREKSHVRTGPILDSSTQDTK